MKDLIPKPLQKPHFHEHLGDRREDPYFWMRERDSEAVLAHLKSENEYFESLLGSTKPLQEQLFKEMKSRVKEDDSSPASPYGAFEYYVRYETGKEYQIYCRRPRGGGSEEILLNVNELAVGQSYCDVGSMKVSPNHERIAFAFDRVGRRLFSLMTKDLKTGQVSNVELPGTAGNFEWADDSRTLFAVMKHPETLRYEKCLRFDSHTGTQELVFFEANDVFGLHIGKSLNENSIFLVSHSFNASEVRRIDPKHPQVPPELFAAREEKHEYMLDDAGDGFFVLTNWKAENFRLMWAPSFPSAKETWTEILPHDPKIFLSGFLCLRSHIILEERFAGLTRLRILDRTHLKAAGSTVEFPDPTYVTSLASNLEYVTTSFRLTYASPVQPRTWYDCDLKTGKLSVVKKSEVPNYDSTKYECARIWATAKDGTLVPMSVLGPKGFQSHAPRPTLVYGYGSYGYSVEPSFGANIFSLIDRGFLFAIAHVRGGSDMGRAWYEHGRMAHKKNTFSDFVSCADHLIDSKLTDPEQIYAMGGSAGGLLMGAVINLRPELFRGIVAQVPFVDVVTTMLDPSIPLTTAEYEQWGNPNEKEAYQYIKSYSPYDNVTPSAYPYVYIETGYHDSQVQYWEPAKWAARLRDMKTTPNPVIFRTNMDAGHGGASGRFERLKEVAIEYAFILWTMNQPRAR